MRIALVIVLALFQDPAAKREFDQKRDALKGKDPDAHVTLGRWAVEKGLKDEARWAFQKAWDIEPGHPDARDDLKALGYELDGKQFRPIKEVLEKRRRQLPKGEVDGLYRLAVLAKDFSQEKEYKRYLDDCIKANPDHPESREELGFTRHYGEWYTEAQIDIERRLDDAWSLALDLKKPAEQIFEDLKSIGYRGTLADVQRVVKFSASPTGMKKDVRLEMASGDLSKGKYAYGIPEEYKPWRKFPVLVFIHGTIQGVGSGEDGYAFIAPRSRKRGWLTVCPGIIEAVSDYPWNTDKSEKWVRAIIREFSTKYCIDEGRIYLVGESAGGFGAFYLGSRMTDVFAAISPWAGGSEGAVFGSLKFTPTYIIHNNGDKELPVASSRNAAQQLESTGATVVYVEPDSQAHTVPVVEQEKALDWMERFRINVRYRRR